MGERAGTVPVSALLKQIPGKRRYSEVRCMATVAEKAIRSRPLSADGPMTRGSHGIAAALFALVWLSCVWFGSWPFNPNNATRLFGPVRKRSKG